MIFDYKVIKGRKCGFPDNALNKVLEKLDDYKISYQIIYTDKNPIVKDYKKLNNYEAFYTKSLYLIEKQNKIDIIVDKITNASSQEIDRLMEKLLDVSHK